MINLWISNLKTEKELTSYYKTKTPKGQEEVKKT